MKTLTVLAVSLIFINQISGYLIKIPTVPTASPELISQPQGIHLQKLIIPLFQNVCELSSDPTIQSLAQEFTLDANDYPTPQIVTKFQNLKSNGLLAKGTIFTEYDVNHMNELKIVYEVLYTAKDFDTFYKAAAWARQNVNCVLYVNAIYMAILNRQDTQNLYIPAPYEILPNYFINKDAIIKAASILGGIEAPSDPSIRFTGNSYTIDANYTALFFNNEDDSKLAYFREDIGLNSYYFLRKLRMAPWLNNDANNNFGENMYQMMKQFMARYNLERYANGLPEVSNINWDSSIEVPYDPKLIYSNGNEFGHRTSSLNLSKSQDLLLLQTIENNVAAVVSDMKQSGYNKTQILNELMEIFVTGDRNYETLARQHLGRDLADNGYASVLEHYMTSLRDPIFWQINKKIVDLIDEALKILPSYTRNELYFPGVEVINVDVKKMTTSYDYFVLGVTEALEVDGLNSTLRINIGQPRLNHKTFTIKVNISSILSQKGVMKIYLGPNLMPFELVQKKNLFTLLDVSEINLKIGSNIITRSSDNMKHFSEDFMPLNTIRKKINDAEFGLDSLTLNTIQSQIGYPSRLILPKGTSQGLPLQMFVFIAPYFKSSFNEASPRVSMEFNTAILSPGYPLDLLVDSQQLFGLPNAMIKYVTILQKAENKVENYDAPGVTKSWNDFNTYDSSSRPKYTSNYSQFRNQNEYSKSYKFNADKDSINDEENTDIDPLNVVGLNYATRAIPLTAFNDKYDYNFNRKEPFDYKTKKGQFGNKDVNYEKYKTKTNNEKPLSTSTTQMSMTQTIDRDEIGEELVSNIYEDTLNVYKDEMKSANNKIILEVEPLPSPLMLTQDKENVDYRVKKMERDFKVKMIKNELDKIIKDAKSINYKNIKYPVPVAVEMPNIDYV